jgi:hypothetical protein
VKRLTLILTLALFGCAAPPQPSPVPTQAVAPIAQPIAPTQPQPAPEHGTLEVCVDGLGGKLTMYPLQVSGAALYATTDNPGPRMERQPAGAVWLVEAHDGPGGLRATPNGQSVTIRANQTTTARVRVGWEEPR